VRVTSSSSSGPYPKPVPLAPCGCAAPPGAPPHTAFTFTVPARSSRHAAWACAIDGVRTVAARPYSVALAAASASSNEPTARTAATGPNVSRA
jgi:hypothetical protein